jgi:hypothetical protein
MAQRFYVLSKLGYGTGGPFYRVLRNNATSSFVTQFGYHVSADAGVDQAWLQHQTLNTTAPLAQSNSRGTVAFGTGYEKNSGDNPDCTAPDCSIGFSVELFINLRDNGAKLDASDFSVFGVIEEEEEMRDVVDNVYAGYGECADMCSQPGVGASDPFCYANTQGGWQGVDLTQMLAQGRPYLDAYPKMDYVTDIAIVAE